MDAPLRRHLSRFPSPPSADGAAVAPGLPGAPAEGAAQAEAARERAREELVALRVDAARAEAAAKAAAEAEAGFAARLQPFEDERAALERRCAEMERAGEAALAQAQADWARSGAAALLERLDEGLALLRAELAAALAAAVRPLLETALAERALVLFAEALDRLVADPAHPAVLVRGPAALVEALRGMRPAAAAVGFEVREGEAELVMLANGARVETRLAEARAALLDALRPSSSQPMSDQPAPDPSSPDQPPADDREERDIPR